MELKQLDEQMTATQLRRKLAARALTIHQQNIENEEATLDFLADKFTNDKLYAWMSSSLRTLYRDAFNSALAMAKLAERAYRFERGEDCPALLQSSYWDAAHGGLLAGEQLIADLNDMERRFAETNYRLLEMDQPFSLMQLDPAALMELRETGRCTFSVPELAFDLFYPGHYRWRIKGVRLTIHCVTPPYTNISACLSLLGSRIRKDPVPGDGGLSAVPLRHSSTIANSSGQQDSGVPEFSLRDERYLPFEGSGAISDWEFKLPNTVKPFDYQTSTDVIIHISYTAL